MVDDPIRSPSSVHSCAHRPSRPHAKPNSTLPTSARRRLPRPPAKVATTLQGSRNPVNTARTAAKAFAAQLGQDGGSPATDSAGPNSRPRQRTPGIGSFVAEYPPFWGWAVAGWGSIMDGRLRRAPDAEWVLIYRLGLSRQRIAALAVPFAVAKQPNTPLTRSAATVSPRCRAGPTTIGKCGGRALGQYSHSLSVLERGPRPGKVIRRGHMRLWTAGGPAYAPHLQSGTAGNFFHSRWKRASASRATVCSSACSRP